MWRRYRRTPALLIALIATLLVPLARSDVATQPTEVWFVGAGDIADCRDEGGDREASRRTRWILDRIKDEAAAAGIPVAIFTVGDNSYRLGDGAFSVTCYEYPLEGSLKGWGRHKSITYPAPGNHDYHPAHPNGERYHDYFTDLVNIPNPVAACSAAGASNPRWGPFANPFSTIQCGGGRGRGYYTFRFGDWRIIVLNTERVDSEQLQWLEAVLQSEPSRACTLAIWHHPRFSSGEHGDQDGSGDPPKVNADPLWTRLRDLTILRDKGAVVISAHDHNYQRFSPSLTFPDGITPNPAWGVREFVVGTGGAIPYGFPIESLGSWEYRSTPLETLNYGVLLLKLRADNYDSALRTVDPDGVFGEEDSLTGLSCRPPTDPPSGLVPIADTYISEAEPDSNFGNVPTLRVDGDDPPETGTDLRALLKWDVSTIPPGSTVTSATISVNITNQSAGTYQIYQMRPLLELGEWDESTVTWNSRGVRDDRILGDMACLALGRCTFSLNPTGRAVVQGWVNGTVLNRGLVILNTDVTDGVAFDSRETANPPTLTIR